jgi:hypothetical protein
LPGRLLEADVPVGDDAVAVHDDAYTRLMPLRVNIVESHHIHAMVLKISVFGF